jgi:RNA polymerase sigma-70 factor (ECF subfamily)
MVPSLLERAQGGDDDAFGEVVAPYRGELHLHCYRMLGSLADADDVLQETMIAAWKAIGGSYSTPA